MRLRLLLLAQFMVPLSCGVPESEEEEQGQCSTVEHPEAIGLESDEELSGSYGVTNVINLPEHKVLVFHECDSDYKIVFYRPENSGFVPDASEFVLLGFEPPVLMEDPEPTVWTRHVESGERFYFQVHANGIDLLPDDGQWRELSPRVKAHHGSDSLEPRD